MMPGVDGNGPKRFSVQRKMAIVARLLRGEPLELAALSALPKGLGCVWYILGLLWLGR